MAQYDLAVIGSGPGGYVCAIRAAQLGLHVAVIENQAVEAKTIVIATGSDSAPLKGVEVDERRIVTSTGALTLSQVPKRLIVVGAGVIGLELGSVWRRLRAAG